MDGSGPDTSRFLSPGVRQRGRSGWPAAVLAAAVIVCVYLFSASRTTLWDRDEPLFARATVEMIESGNYLYPTFNGQLFPDKPILVYWLMSLPVRLLGPTELACRFFSALGIAATCLLTYYIGRRLFSAPAGLWAMLVLASSPMVLAIGKLATADGVLLPFIVAALACFAASLRSGIRAIHLVLLGGATGLAMLAKGPLGLVPLVVIAAALLLGRRTLPLGGRYLLYCLLATLGGLAIFCAWGIPANEATGGEFLRLHVGHHVIARSVRPFESHGGNFLLYLPFYLPAVLIGFFPWVLHLPGSLSAALGGRLGGRQGRAVLLAMILPVFIIMTFVATKLAHYILAIWPGLALAVGATIQAWGDRQLTDRDRRWLRRGAWLLGILGGAAALGALIGPWFIRQPPLRIAGTVVGLLLAAMTFLAVRCHLARGPVASAKVLLAGMLAVELALHLLVAPALEQVKVVPGLAGRIKTATGPDVPVATYGFGEPSVNFYVGRPVRSFVREKASPQQVLDWLGEPADGVLIVTARHLRRLEATGRAVDAEVIASARGIDFAKVKWVELTALRRGAGSGRSAKR